MKTSRLKILNFKVWLLLVLMFTTSSVFAWSATSLGGGNWAITCANGTSWSYSGSSAGLDVVGPALCPAGIVVVNPNGNLPKGVTRGVSQKVNQDIIRNTKEIGDNKPQGLRRYPPHGYPCLGCVPCPPDYCDDAKKNTVFIAPPYSVFITPQAKAIVTTPVSPAK
ncbi:hypothetical protein [Crenothrix sp.]|uniref:hypothetical protein n=1 Tax=Crenothrix sp. TaxID=3100433 RepID=UPI00374CF27B